MADIAVAIGAAAYQCHPMVTLTWPAVQPGPAVVMPANRFETLATWYLRLNGYFTTPDFTVHPEFRRKPGGTDADVLAVRFPHSEEYQRRFDFRRDPSLVRLDRTDFLICEVKSGPCDVNGKTWRDRARRNVEYAIRWMGFAPDEECIKALADDIYNQGECDLAEQQVSVRFVCFGSDENPELRMQLPRVQQILHPHVVKFLRQRFSLGCYNITRDNWDPDIVDFAARCGRASDLELLEWAKDVRQ